MKDEEIVLRRVLKRLETEPERPWMELVRDYAKETPLHLRPDGVE